MNNKHQENGALAGLLIFTLPASSFVVILRLDWLEGDDRAATPSNISRQLIIQQGYAFCF
jgi:hypothetical protein